MVHYDQLQVGIYANVIKSDSPCLLNIQGSDAARVKAELLVEDGEGWSDWINAKRPNGVPLERWAGEWDISILEALPDEPGRYEWGIKAPDSDMVVPVYHGKTGGENSSNTLKKRLVKYVRDGSHGAMKQKMDELLKKGFTFYVRIKVGNTYTYL